KTKAAPPAMLASQCCTSCANCGLSSISRTVRVLSSTASPRDRGYVEPSGVFRRLTVAGRRCCGLSSFFGVLLQRPSRLPSRLPQRPSRRPSRAFVSGVLLHRLSPAVLCRDLVPYRKPSLLENQPATCASSAATAGM